MFLITQRKSGKSFRMAANFVLSVRKGTPKKDFFGQEIPSCGMDPVY
jgi:hypothetical protein